MNEYSYFRAEGLSLEAFATMKEAHEEFDRMKAKLCAKFGANDFMGGYNADEKRFRIVSFHFRADQEVPDGWKERSEQRAGNGALQCTFAMPAPNTPDHFYMANMCGLMERASRQMGLHDIFGVEWFMRENAEGKIENAFVRQKYLGDPGSKGKISQTNINYGGSGGGKVCDPLSALELDGKMYIRVPNKPGTEEPICIPPDAVRMSYEDMLKADQAEWDRRNTRHHPPICWGF